MGLADNGDFSRIAEPLGILPVGRPEDLYFRWVLPRYAFDAGRIWLGGLCCYSSQTALAGIALPVGLLISPPGRFDIQAMGIVNAVALLAAAGLLLLALGPLPAALRVLGAILVVVFFTDVAYVALLNSFYTEPAALVFFVSTVGLALLLAQRDEPSGPMLAGYFGSVALLATSRPQNAMLGILFALLGIGLAGRGSARRRGFAIAAAVAVCLLSVAYSRQTPRLLRRIYLYNAVFRELLPKSPTPRQDLIALGLDPSLDRLAGTSGYEPGVPIGQREFDEKFFDRIDYGSLATFYAARPERLRTALERGASDVFEGRSPLGNFTKSAGRAPGARSGSFAAWSGAKARFLPARLPFVMAFLLINLAAAAALRLRGRSPATRRSAEIWMAVSLVAGYQFALASLMDAGSERALFLFHASFDLLCAALVLVAGRGVLAVLRRRRAVAIALAAASFAAFAALPANLGAEERAFDLFGKVELIDNRREEEPEPVPQPVQTSGRRRFFTAAGEVALFELIPWAFDRYIADYDFARISWDTVERNFETGFEYDPDTFEVNQSSHPYHGSLFFNAARQNGYGFWESAAFALAGSLLWECCFENTPPSTNDVVNTTLGGMTRGEVAHRLSAMILDNEARGANRIAREIGAGILNPAALLNRLLRGEFAREFENSADRFPSLVVLSTDLGYRRFTGGVSHPDQWIATLSFQYGDPFEGAISRPFDSFWVGLDASSPGGVLFTRIEERGVLKGWELTERTASVRHIFGFSQEYEYLNNASQVFGAQIVSAGLLSRYAILTGVTAFTDAAVFAIPLAGIPTTDFENPETGRNYDYAPGGGARVGGRVYLGTREVLDVGYGIAWTHTVNGVSEDNTLQFVRATGRIPLFGFFAGGAGFSWYSRKTTYPGVFVERRTQSEWRIFLNATFPFR